MSDSGDVDVPATCEPTLANQDGDSLATPFQPSAPEPRSPAAVAGESEVVFDSPLQIVAGPSGPSLPIVSVPSM